MREWSTGLDLVVVNYRTPDDLREFLRSFDYWHDGTPEVKLWISNVDSTPADEQVAKDYLRTARNADHLTHLTNVGFARAVNDAAARGDREIIAIFNADTRLTAGLLEDCWARLNWSDGYAILGPRQVDDEDRISHGGIFGTFEAPKLRGWREPNSERFADIRDAITVSGSAYFIKRSVWEELTACPVYRGVVPEAEGAFLPTPHYYEETWCSYHAQAHGYKVMYYGPACMVHRWHKASPVGGYADQVLMSQSREMFRYACDQHQIPHD